LTIICIKDGVVAADSATFSGSLLISQAAKKIVRSKDGAIGAMAGGSSYAMLFSEWFANSTKDDRLFREVAGSAKNRGLPIIEKDDTYYAIWLERDGSIWNLHSADLIPYTSNEDIGAVGSQTVCAMALGAMRGGVSAEEAVAICIKHSADAGGVVNAACLSSVEEKENVDDDEPPVQPAMFSEEWRQSVGLA
jgi:ATP-dependent protease HslVU (ClpYQ) peptidase subunit